MSNINAWGLLNSWDSSTALAGRDQRVPAGSLVTLGVEPDDGEEPVTSYSWVKLDGHRVTINDSGARQPTFIAPNLGVVNTLTFEVTSDAGLASETVDTVVITVEAINTAWGYSANYVNVWGVLHG